MSLKVNSNASLLTNKSYTVHANLIHSQTNSLHLWIHSFPFKDTCIPLQTNLFDFQTEIFLSKTNLFSLKELFHLETYSLYSIYRQIHLIYSQLHSVINKPAHSSSLADSKLLRPVQHKKQTNYHLRSSYSCQSISSNDINFSKICCYYCSFVYGPQAGKPE